jgi:biotin operon repressor
MDAHKVRFDERLAKELGVDVDKLRAALEQLSKQRPDGPADFPEALADELDMDASEVEEALQALRPRPGARLPGPHRGAPLRKLAEALDVTRAELRKALREVRAGAESGWEQHGEKLAAFLADRFGLDVDDVEKALADVPRPTFRTGPHGPGGPELHGPGPGGPDGPGFGLSIG